MYIRYHGLTLARAAECKSVQEPSNPAGPRLTSYLEEWRREFMILEAMGPHFRQDARRTAQSSATLSANFSLDP